MTVSNLTEQDELVEKLLKAYPDAKIYDRVAKPSHGYRAKHLVVKIEGRRIEIQVRTRMQHQWALLSENAADLFGQEIKYGLGDASLLEVLDSFSQTFKEIDESNISVVLLDLIETRQKELRERFFRMKNDLLH